jgi:toxin FitB
MYLLDTNVISELRKSKPHGAVLTWINQIQETDLHLAAVTIGEIQAGIEISRERDPKKALEIERWLDLVSNTYRVLPMDGAAFREWARLMHRTSDTLYEDAMVAAIAKVHRLVVATRNVVDFESFGVEVVNPFQLTVPT